jgi:hypothetical protein
VVTTADSVLVVEWTLQGNSGGGGGSSGGRARAGEAMLISHRLFFEKCWRGHTVGAFQTAFQFNIRKRSVATATQAVPVNHCCTFGPATERI